MKIARFVVFVVVAIAVVSCQTVFPTTASTEVPGLTSEAEALESLVPTTVVPTPTETLVPTPTSTPIPTPSPTPSGRTELGTFVQSLADDLGVNLIISRDVKEACSMFGLEGFVYQEGESRTFASGKMDGFIPTDDTKNFLLISRSVVGGSLMVDGGMIGFSLYEGEVATECQGYYPLRSLEFHECIDEVQGTSFYNGNYDEYGLTYAVVVAYPLSVEQTSILRTRHNLTTYPNWFKVKSTGRIPCN